MRWRPLRVISRLQIPGIRHDRGRCTCRRTVPAARSPCVVRAGMLIRWSRARSAVRRSSRATARCRRSRRRRRDGGRSRAARARAHRAARRRRSRGTRCARRARRRRRRCARRSSRGCGVRRGRGTGCAGRLPPTVGRSPCCRRRCRRRPGPVPVDVIALGHDAADRLVDEVGAVQEDQHARHRRRCRSRPAPRSRTLVVRRPVDAFGLPVAPELDEPVGATQIVAVHGEREDGSSCSRSSYAVRRARRRRRTRRG